MLEGVDCNGRRCTKTWPSPLRLEGIAMEEDATKHGKAAVSCHPKTWPEGIAMEEDAQKRGKALSCRPSTEEEEEEDEDEEQQTWQMRVQGRAAFGMILLQIVLFPLPGGPTSINIILVSVVAIARSLLPSQTRCRGKRKGKKTGFLN
jgi:hypothetical protein